MVAQSNGAPALRVAIIGAGLMGTWHARAAHRLGAQITAIADPQTERAIALAKECGPATALADPFEVLQPGRVDAVHICTPSATHETLIERALDAGIHVLVEKPLAHSAAETQRLIGNAERKGVILCPVHQVAFQDGVAAAAHELAGLGTVRAIDFRICSAGGEGRGDPELDEIVAEILPHPMSVLRRLWPQAAWEPRRWPVTRPQPGELLVAGQHAGALLSLLVSMHARPTCFEMAVQGDQGSLHCDFFHGFAARLDGAVSRWRKIVQPFAASTALFGGAAMNLVRRGMRGETAYPGLRPLIEAFHAAARGQGPSPISPADTIAVAAARDAIMAAAGSPARDAPGAPPLQGEALANKVAP